MAENNKTILETANAAMTKGDHEGFLAFCVEETEWTFVGDTVIKGKEALRQWMKTAYVEPPKFTTTNLIAEDDFVVALGEIITKDKSGKEVPSCYCDVWRFRDGKIVGLKAFVIPAGPGDNPGGAA